MKWDRAILPISLATISIYLVWYGFFRNIPWISFIAGAGFIAVMCITNWDYVTEKEKHKGVDYTKKVV